MARRANISQNAGDDEDESLKGSTSSHFTRRRAPNISSLSPSPAASFSSDKENREARLSSPQGTGAKARAMPPPKIPTPNSDEAPSPRASKRRRLSERHPPSASQAVHARELQKVGNRQFYDPDQSIEERRALRKEIRDLSKELNDSRTEFLAAGSEGLFKTIEKANEIFGSVKQTSDATLDSRLLVSAADLSAKRTTQLNLGDTSQGIDVDEFVGKCKAFMRHGSGGRRRRYRQDANSGEDDSVAEGSADEGDAYDWERLGCQACFPNNLRPPVSGFLLGPLSVQKKVRKQTQRRERLQKRDPREAVRPEELKAQDLQKKENSDLTTLCKKIYSLLAKIQTEGPDKVRADVTEEMTDEEVGIIMARHKMANDGGVPFFQFVINPRSFGQTVENMFYVSFLIRDGTAGIYSDSNGLPTLHASKPREKKEIHDHGVQKHQAVFHLDFPTWEDLIDAFDITESIIPHRQSDEEPQVSASGWYG